MRASAPRQPASGLIAGRARRPASRRGCQACQTSSAAPATATRCCASSAPKVCPANRSTMAVPARPAAAIAARPGKPGRQRRADRADSERDGQRQVERAELVRGMHPRVMVMPEDKQRHRDRQLCYRHGDQPGPLGKPQSPPGAGGKPSAPAGRGRGQGRSRRGAPAVSRCARAAAIRGRPRSRQVSVERVGGQARVLSVDPGRDGLADLVASHAQLCAAAGKVPPAAIADRWLPYPSAMDELTPSPALPRVVTARAGGARPADPGGRVAAVRRPRRSRVRR